MSGDEIVSLMKLSMWKNKPFLCSYKKSRQMGHFNQHMTLGNLMGLTGYRRRCFPMARPTGLLIIVVLLLGRLLPQERDKACIQGFIVHEIPTNLVLQLFNPRF
jgi:hypothetical protein